MASVLSLMGLLLFIQFAPFGQQLLNTLFPKIVSRAVGNQVSVGALQLAATYESISVYSNFLDDDNNNQNSPVLEYRKVEDANWIRGMDMTLDRRATVSGADCGAGNGACTNPFRNQWRGSVLMVTPDTDYEVKVTYSDPDGVNGTNPAAAMIRTRTDNVPVSGRILNVTTPADLTSALNGALAGDTIIVGPGSYGAATISRSGTASNWILIKAADLNNKPHFSAASRSTGISLTVNGAYLKISGFEIQNGNNGLVFGGTSHDVIFEKGFIHDSGGGDPDIVPPPVKIGSSTTQNATYNITIQDNDIRQDTPESEQNVVEVQASAGGFIIRNNRITFSFRGTPSKHGTDCIGGLPNFAPRGGFGNDVDIYNNYCLGATDEGIEIDGGNANVRVWGNTIVGTNLGFSITPVHYGPVYVFRNVVYGFQTQWISNCVMVKDGEDGAGFVYFYHNTFHGNDRSQCGTQPQAVEGFAKYGSGGAARNVFVRNNIIESWGRLYDGSAADGDYNLNYLNPASNDKTSDNHNYNEPHSIYPGKATFVQLPTYVRNGSVLTSSAADFHLQAGSLGIDRGLIIPGFNDANSPWPFTGSAPDIGAFETGGAIVPTSTLGPTSPPTIIPTTIPTATLTPTPTTIPTPTRTPTPIPTPTVPPGGGVCTLTSAAWSTGGPVTEGTTVSLNVVGNLACAGQTVSFEVREDDAPLGSSAVPSSPSQVIFNSSGQAVTNWISEYQCDGLLCVDDPPEYYFVARIPSGLTIASPNGLGSDALELKVNQSNAPRFSITQPINGGSIVGSTVVVVYSSSGDLVGLGADNVHLKLDSDPEIVGLPTSGNFSFSGVGLGTHTLTGYLARADNSQVGGTLKTVNFSTLGPTPTPTQAPTSTPTPTPTVTPTPTNIPTPTPTSTPTPTNIPTPTPTPTPVLCTLVSATWSSLPANPVAEGVQVGLTVQTAGGCSGQTVQFKVWEDDGLLGSDVVAVNPADATVGTLGLATTSWLTEYQIDGVFGIGGLPEFYFEANFQGKSVTIRSSDPELGVTPGTTTLRFTSLPLVETATDSVTIKWSTNVLSNAKLDYGLPGIYRGTTPIVDPGFDSTDHQVLLANLKSCATYLFRIVSTDVSSTQIIGSDSTFTTKGCTGNSTVLSQAHLQINNLSGGQIELLDTPSHGIRLDLPVNFASASANLQIKKLEKTAVLTSETPPAGYLLIANHLYNLQALSDISVLVNNFNLPLNLTFLYTDSDVAGLDPTLLRVYQNEGGGTGWRDAGCIVDSALKQVKCIVTRFSDFGLFGTSPPAYSQSSYASGGSYSQSNYSSGGGGGGGGSPRQGDLNGDSRVNIFDLSIILRNFGRSGAGDINGSGKVDIFDLSIFLKSWTG